MGRFAGNLGASSLGYRAKLFLEPATGLPTGTGGQVAARMNEGGPMGLFSQHHTFGFQSATTNMAAREVTYDEPRVEVSLILEGSLTFFVDGEKRLIEAPCATFQAYRKSLEVIAPAGRQIRTMWCHFSSNELSEAEWQSVDKLPPIQSIPTRLPALFSSALSLPNDDDLDEPQFNDRVRDALGVTIFSEYIRAAKSARLAKPMPPTVAAAKRVLDQDYMQAWSVEAIAAITGTNANYLIDLFNKHVGVSPMRYLWNRRVDAGVQLLQTTTLTIDEISHRCGFQSAAHFSRRVKERTGIPPSLMRCGLVHP
jgi:AraC-like DNA-binding protein